MIWVKTGILTLAQETFLQAGSEPHQEKIDIQEYYDATNGSEL